MGTRLQIDSDFFAGAGLLGATSFCSSETLSLSAARAKVSRGAWKLAMLRFPVALVEPMRGNEVGEVERVLSELQVHVANIDWLRQRRSLERGILHRAAAAEIHGVGVLDRAGGAQVERDGSAAAHAFDRGDAVGLGDVEQLIDLAVDGF